MLIDGTGLLEYVCVYANEFVYEVKMCVCTKCFHLKSDGGYVSVEMFSLNSDLIITDGWMLISDLIITDGSMLNSNVTYNRWLDVEQ